MSVENYVRTAPDSLGKYVQAKEETKDGITVHTPVTILEDTSGNLVSPAKETGGNLATIATNTASLAQPTAAETPNSNLSGGNELNIVPSYTANTKGSWYQITAATAAETKGIFIIGHLQWVTAATIPKIFVDIAIGTTVILPDLPLILNQPTKYSNGSVFIDGVTGFLLGAPTYIPIKIPLGSQVQARSQSSIGGFGCNLTVVFME